MKKFLLSISILFILPCIVFNAVLADNLQNCRTMVEGKCTEYYPNSYQTSSYQLCSYQQYTDLQNKYNEVEKLYNQLNESIQNDWRLQNQGYQLTPEQLSGTITGLLMGESITPATVAKMKWQADIANRYGVPYEQWAAAQSNIQNQQIQLKYSQIKNYTELMKLYQEQMIQCMRNMQNRQ